LQNWLVAIQASAPYLIGICLAVSLMLIGKQYVFFWLADEKVRLPDQFDDNAAIILRNERNQLRPVEFAYLMRNGDGFHAMAVLVVDLVQRVVKSNISSTQIPLADYEVAMCEVVKKSVTSWANEKKEGLMLESFKKDPAAYVRRWSGLYAFLRKSIKPFISGVTRDPRNLRRYFSFGGIFRLITDFSTAGYQQAFQQELKQSLLARGFIVSGQRKEAAAKVTTIVGAVGLLLAAFFSTFILHSFFLFILAGLVAVFTRGVLFLKSMIPFYSDILNLFTHIERGGTRLRVIQTIAVTLNNIFYGVAALFFLIGIFCLHVYLRTAGHAIDTLATYICAIAMSGFLIVCCEVLLTGMRIKTEEWQTARGHRLAEKIRDKIRTASPLDEFKVVLQNTEYNETFSDVVGLYGIETLLFLA
jgi:hypothetical protein